MKKLLLFTIFLVLIISPAQAELPDADQFKKTDVYEEHYVLGLELYSYTENGSDIKYSLLQTTDILKSDREIVGSSISYEELLREISKLPSGSYISWIIELPEGFTHEGFTLQYPEDAKVKEIESLCEKLEINLLLDQVRSLGDIDFSFLLSGLLSLLTSALVLLVFIVTLVGFLVSGPGRWVKILCLVLIILFAVDMCLRTSSLDGLYYLLFVLLFTFLINIIGTSTYKKPYPQVLNPLWEKRWPQHSITKIDKWTNEFDSLGFKTEYDKVEEWAVLGSKKKSFIRFLRHPQEPVWIELHSISFGKQVARLAVTKKDNGTLIFTSDMQSDNEILRDRLIKTQRVPRKLSCKDFLDNHKKFISKSGGKDMYVETIGEEHEQSHNEWIKRLIKNGALKKQNGSVKIPLARIPLGIMRMYKAWFH